MKVHDLVTGRVSGLADELADLLKNERMTDEEREAITEAERLSELFEDVKPERLVVTGNHLFQLPTN